MAGFNRFKDIHFSNVEAAKSIQETQLGKHILYCRKNSPYYRKVLNNFGINIKNLTLEQLADLPFTTRSHIEDNESEFYAVSSDQVIDIVFSAGITGRPIRLVYSDYDLRRLAYSEKQALMGCGVSEEDVVLLTSTIDRCFSTGLAHFLGVRDLGATAIRCGYTSMQSCGEIIDKIAPTIIIGAPSYLRKLGAYLLEKGRDPGKTHVSKLICSSEPIQDKYLNLNKIGHDLQKIWQADVFSIYSSTEIETSFCECSFQRGAHIHPDLAIVEIVDEKGLPLPAGVIGEVVVTPMGVKGMPLLRFKTGDISYLIDEPCLCERTSARLGPILGRKEHMMKIQGKTIYPQKLYSALDEIKAINDYFIIANSENNVSDTITIFAAVNAESCTTETIQNELQKLLHVKPKVVIGSEKAINQQIYTSRSVKPVRFIDRR
ncbi:MAG: phenylacetate--CoA ligase family protein [bacterium]